MVSVGCRIHTHPARTDPGLVERFRNIPVANLDDCMGRTAALSSAIRPYGPRRQTIRPINKAPLLGTAFTVKVAEGDNLFFHKAMDMAQPGDVFVIDAFGCEERSILGELMVSYCKIRGASGIVVDGCIRDADAIRAMNFPIYARGVTPNGPYKNGPGEIGGAVVVGGQVIRPGDILAGDGDGIVVIRPEDAEEILEQVEKLMANESRTLSEMKQHSTYIRPWVDEKLAELKCEYL